MMEIGLYATVIYIVALICGAICGAGVLAWEAYRLARRMTEEADRLEESIRKNGYVEHRVSGAEILPFRARRKCVNLEEWRRGHKR
jgi:glycerol uptake facilitator-like aquaporin